MPVTQDQANRILGRYEQQIADLLGIPVPADFRVLVMPAAEFAKKYPGWGGGATTNMVIIPDNINDPERLRRVIAYEAAHALTIGPGANTDIGEHGLTGSKAGKASEALSGVILAKLGLQPPNWAPDPRQAKLMALDDTQLASVGTAIREGSFESIDDSANAAPANDTGAPNGGNNNTPSETGAGGGTTTESDTGFGTVPPPPPPADTGPSPADVRAGFLATLNAYQIPITANLTQLIQHATQGGWSLNRFKNWLRKTPEYQDAFPGIFNPDGTTKMSEAQYVANQHDYENIAAQAGVNINEGTIAWAIHNNVSPSEFSTRAPALRQLQTNPELYAQFGKALVQEGKAKPGDITDQALLRFVMGKGNSQWQDTWDLASARYAATQAGLQLQKGVDKYLALNPGLIQAIANKGLSPDALAGGFQDMAASLLKDVPLSRIQGAGLTRKEIAAAAFGGKHSTEIRARIEKLHAQENAFNSQQPATTQTYADANGNVGEVGGATQRRAQ